MTVKVLSASVSHLKSLISQGKYDASASWSYSPPATVTDWSAYAKEHLAEDTAETEKTKGRYKYPVAKNGKVYRSGVIAAKQRAAQQKLSSIENAANSLLELIDKKEQNSISALLGAIYGG